MTEAEPDLVLVALDARNAFCSADREACLQNLAEHALDLLPCADLFSARLSRYFFWDSSGGCQELTSTSGVDQGDPLAPLLFACGLAPKLAELEKRLRQLAQERGLDPNRVRVLAYLDDVTVLVPPELATEVLPAAQAALGALGLELRADKTQAWSRESACPPGLQEHWRPHGLTLVGVPLGEPLPANGLPDSSDAHRVDLGGGDFASHCCCEVADRATALLERLADLPTHASPHLPAVQVAALLLRVCGAGKVTHLLRSNPPATVVSAASRFDKALLEAYVALAALDPLTTEQAAQCQLPVRDGGRGLRSQAQLAPAAWVGSWGQCLSEVVARTGLACLTDFEHCELPLAVECRNALASLPPAADTNEEVSWQELAQRPRPKLQKHLSNRLSKKNFADLLNALDLEGRTRLRSCSGPLAGAWQLASPGFHSQRLEDADYRTAARTLLGQPAATCGTTCCNRARTGEKQTCGVALCAQAHHAHRCARGGGTKARSADLERVLECIHRECGHAVERQVHVPGWDRFHWHCGSCDNRGTAWERPGSTCARCGGLLHADREEAVLDLEVRSARFPRAYFDVTVRHSVSGDQARLALASKTAGAVAKEAEGDKRRRYPDGRTPFRVVPFAVVTFGRLGKTALKHLRELARERAAHSEEGSDELASALLQRWAG